MRPSSVPHVIVLAGGDGSVPTLRDPLPEHVRVIAADGGLSLARPLGLPVHLVVGDLDSVAPEVLAEAVEAGAEVERHPTAKDRTDLAIALDAAAAEGAEAVTVVGGHGGRLDHLLAGALLLASPAYAGMLLTARMGPAVVTVVRSSVTLRGVPGETVSLVPVHGPAEGVTTRGLRFPLADERLPEGSSRGVSNEFVEPRAEVRLTGGVLLAVQPAHGSTTPDPART